MSKKRPTLALDSSLVQDNTPIEIVSRLYIGSLYAAFNQDAMVSLGITHVLNSSRLAATFPKLFTYLSIDIRDQEHANLLSCIPSSNIFIEAGMDAGGILVHCVGGRSRSVAFVAAFLMSSCGWSFDYVINIIKTARPAASINPGFEAQLRAYAQTNYDVYAAQQIQLQSRLRVLKQLRVFDQDTMECLHRNSPILNESTEAVGYKRSWVDSRDMYTDDNDEEDSAIDTMYKVEPTLDEDDKILMTAALNLMRKSRNSDATNDRSNSPSTSPVANTIVSSKIEKIMGQVPVMDVKTPYCRLSRPGNSQTVRVIPPLRGLDRKVCCAWCSSQLFCLANVIRTDINSLKFLDDTMKAEDKGVSHYDFDGEYTHDDEYIESAVSVSHSIMENGLIHSSTSMVTAINSASDAKYIDSYSNTVARTTVIMTADSSHGSAAVALPKSFVSPPKTSRAKPVGFKAFDFGDSNDSNGSSRMRVNSDDDDLIAFTLPLATSPNGRYNANVPVFTDATIQSFEACIPRIQHATKSYADSPRIPIPPLKEAVNGVGGAAITGLTPDVWSSNERPQSVEKKRWLARLSLLRDSIDNKKVAKVAEDDNESVSYLLLGKEKYIYVEYLKWMGPNIFFLCQDIGEINCYHCNKVIGSYSWSPSPLQSLNGKLEAPLIRIHKGVVHIGDVTLDSTPATTPRTDV